MGFTKKQLELVNTIKVKLSKEQHNGDTEIAHCNADDYLCELLIGLGLQDVVDEYEKVDKWYA